MVDAATRMLKGTNTRIIAEALLPAVEEESKLVTPL
jgi:hypothetical protein